MHSFVRFCAVAFALALPPAVHSAGASGSGAAGSGKLFCCIDSTGKHVCSDIVPVSCYGRAYRELGVDGRTIREVDAPLTSEQRAQKAVEEERRKVEEARQKEQQRKDLALLNTYASAEDIEAMRKRALDDAHKSIKNAELKIVEIRAMRKKYENEAEFYKKRSLPAEVKKGLTDADLEIKGQESIIETKKKEIEVIQAKYDDDSRRFQDLLRRNKVVR